MERSVNHYTIKELPLSERPRERLLVAGASALSDAELLALVLATGSTSETAVGLATSMLKKHPLKELVQASAEELMLLPGVGEAKAARIKAAVELARRIASTSLWDKPVIRGADDAANLVMEEMRHLKKEEFRSILLDTKNRVISVENVHAGTANASLVHPREVFREAIRRSATSCILVHNHPSGDPTPSREDVAITERLVRVGDLVGIDVLDHIVIGNQTYLSFKQKGIL